MVALGGQKAGISRQKQIGKPILKNILNGFTIL